MWNLWIFGDSVRKICPYHQISSEHDLVEKVCKTNRSRTKKVINYMIKLACEKQLIQGIRDVRDLKQKKGRRRRGLIVLYIYCSYEKYYISFSNIISIV